MIVEKLTESNTEKLIGGYTDLVQYFNEEEKQSPDWTIEGVCEFT